MADQTSEQMDVPNRFKQKHQQTNTDYPNEENEQVETTNKTEQANQIPASHIF